MNKRKKILAITDQFPNPYEPHCGRFNLWQLTHLKNDHDIKVISPVPWMDWVRFAKREHLEKKIPYVDIINGIEVFRPLYFYPPKCFRSLYGFLYFISILPCVLKVRKKFRFEAIYAICAYPDGFAAILLRKLLGVPVIIEAIGTDMNVYTEFHLRRTLISWALRNSAKVIAVSDKLRKKVVGLGIEEKKTCVVYNGVDHQIFRFEPSEAKNEKMILYVGNLKREKGLSELIDAFSLLEKKEVKLFIIGAGPYESQLMDKIEKNGVWDRVTLLGSLTQDQIARWLNKATFLCLPSYNEGLPNVVLESLACGVPVVATDVGGISEILVSEDYGCVVQPKDVHALAQKMGEVLDRTWDKAKISQYSMKFTWEESAHQLSREFNSCCDESPA